MIKQPRAEVTILETGGDQLETSQKAEDDKGGGSVGGPELLRHCGGALPYLYHLPPEFS